jgi:hypothetical protein
MKKDKPIMVDSVLENADWVKQTNDLPKGSKPAKDENGNLLPSAYLPKRKKEKK